MKTFYAAIALSTAAGAGTAAHAQSSIQFGPRLGLNVSTMTSSGAPSGFNQEIKSVVGVQVGATVNVGINDNLSFQPSLLYTQKGAEFSASDTDTSNPPYKTTIKGTVKPQIKYLEIPLNVVYTFGGQDGFQIFAGPYAAFGVGGGGSAKGEIITDDPDLLAIGATGSFPATLKVEFADKQNDNSSNPNSNPSSLTAVVTVRRFDAGLNAGVGYRKGPYQVQLGYGLGLVNFVPKDTDGNDTGSKGYNRVFQVSANYFFGGK